MTTNTNNQLNQPNINSLTPSRHPHNAKARLPLTTDITKQMLSNTNSPTTTTTTTATSRHMSEQLIRSKSEAPKPIEQLASFYMDVSSNAYKANNANLIQLTSNNNFFPRFNLETNKKIENQKIEEPEFDLQCKPKSNLLLRNSHSVQIAPPVAPKPVFKRNLNPNKNSKTTLMSSQDKNENKMRDKDNNYNRQYNVKTGLKLTNRASMVVGSSVNVLSKQENPAMHSELATILARQKKKIEDATESQSINQHVSAKPPPPPRPQRQQPYVKF